jgi:hypothetical protein
LERGTVLGQIADRTGRESGDGTEAEAADAAQEAPNALKIKLFASMETIKFAVLAPKWGVSIVTSRRTSPRLKLSTRWKAGEPA